MPGTVQYQNLFLQYPYKVGVIIPILQMNMFREVKSLAQGHTANYMAKLGLQPRQSSSETQSQWRPSRPPGRGQALVQAKAGINPLP